MKNLMTVMMTSISEVLETMFFLPVEISGKSKKLGEQMEQYKPWMACSLTFSGDTSGNITLIIPEILLEEMTENFMGTPKEELGNEHISGTLTETLNMICGNALGKVDCKAPFELGIPEIIDESQISSDHLFNIIETQESVMAINIDME